MNAQPPSLLRPAHRGADLIPATTMDAASAAGVAVCLRGVRKSFGSRTVLAGLELAVAPGSFVSIVGRSGEGKSTLLRVLAGLDRADAGTVLLDGVEVAGLSPATTIMFQEARLLPWQRVVANVGIARGPGWRSAAIAALREVGLADRAEEWPRGLSGGQKQRVALARALVRHPGLLLLDEPFGALDALTRADMQRLIARLWREQGFTAVLVTHDVAEAVALADRVVVLRAGHVALDMPVDLPRPRPRTDAAALETRVLDALLA